jgi:S-adenosylmethionine:tRNA ribosyltransferase-isomerase
MNAGSLTTQDFDYDLPPELIAQDPPEERTLSRLMVLDRRRGNILHDGFSGIDRYLQPADLLVLNRTKVIPARLFATKQSGGRVEILLTRHLGNNRWVVLAKPSRKLRAGTNLLIEGAEIAAEAESRSENGMWVLRFHGDGDVARKVLDAGSIPLPPYIRNKNAPLDRYQTVYADREGSVAAPTAGLHFSKQMLVNLKNAGVEIAFVTLHVGPGTFTPVTADRIDDHHMLSEWGEVTSDVAERINQAKRQGNRIVAVGTTTTRLLESAAVQGKVKEFRGEAEVFIRPGHEFEAIDALVTNFHLPRSTLLMLVSAFAGQELIREAYAEAVRRGYRFYSFGDAMLIR